MRKSEMKFLKWPDLDFQKNIITILETKNGEPRHIPMTDRVRGVLMSIKKHSESSYVFYDKQGQPFDCRKSFETALKNLVY